MQQEEQVRRHETMEYRGWAVTIFRVDAWVDTGPGESIING